MARNDLQPQYPLFWILLWTEFCCLGKTLSIRNINQSFSDTEYHPVFSEESEELKADSSTLLCSSFVHTFTGGGVRENVTVGLCCCSAETDGQADSSSELHGEFMSRFLRFFSLLAFSRASSSNYVQFVLSSSRRRLSQHVSSVLRTVHMEI